MVLGEKLDNRAQIWASPFALLFCPPSAFIFRSTKERPIFKRQRERTTVWISKGEREKEKGFQKQCELEIQNFGKYIKDLKHVKYIYNGL